MKIKHLIKIAKRLKAKRIYFYFTNDQFVYNENAGFYFDQIKVEIDLLYITIHFYYHKNLIGYIGKCFYSSNIELFSNFKKYE